MAIDPSSVNQSALFSLLLTEAEKITYTSDPVITRRVDSITKITRKIFDAIEPDSSNESINEQTRQLLKKLSQKLPSLNGLQKFLTELKMGPRNYQLLKATFDSLKTELKKMEKLLAIHHPTIKEERVNSLFFDEHIIERMLFFNHRIKINAEKQLFLYTEQRPLRDKLPDDNLSDLQSFYDNNKETSLVLKIEDPTAQGQFQTYKLSELSWSEFTKLICPEKDKFLVEKVTLLMPQQYLSLDQLIENGVLKARDNKVTLAEGYQYTELGFTNQSISGWNKLLPFNTDKTPLKEFTAEIIVHSKKSGPGVFDAQGHVSIRLKTPNGEDYSVGFYPEDPDLAQRKIISQFGELVSPDPYLFVPTESHIQSVSTLHLPDRASFMKLKEWIEHHNKGEIRDEETGAIKTSTLIYNPIFQNCATFAQELKNYAIKELKAKSQKSQKSSSVLDGLYQITILLQKLIIYIAFNASLIQEKISFNKSSEASSQHVLTKQHIILPIDLV